MTPTNELERKGVEILVAVADARHLLQDEKGRRFFKHLLKRLDILFMPAETVTGEELSAIMGRLRVGNELFQLLCRADAGIASGLLAEIEGERNVFADQRIQSTIEDEY